MNFFKVLFGISRFMVNQIFHHSHFKHNTLRLRFAFAKIMLLKKFISKFKIQNYPKLNFSRSSKALLRYYIKIVVYSYRLVRRH